MLGKRVRLVNAHAMHPQPVWDLIGEEGTVQGHDVTVKEINNRNVFTDIWLVVFDSGAKIWSKKKYLEVIG